MIFPLGGRRILTPVMGVARQRVAGGFTPTDIAGCKLWLDFSDAATLFTDAGSTLVSADGQAIYQVNDKSGQAKHATQTTPESRPLYKVNIKNGLSVSLYDGTNDFLNIPNNIGISGSDNRTFYIVFYYDDDSGNGYCLSFGRKASYERLSTRIYTNDYVILEIEGGNYQTSLGAPDAWISAGYKLDGTTLGDFTIYVNGASEACSGAQTINTDTTLNLIGYSSNLKPFNGYIAEIIAYDTALSDANRILVQNYLNAKWAIY
jgi:hypothetical protein